jgi:hypothetical protein
MVIMSMSPDNCVYAGKVLPEKLLPEVRAGVDKDFTLIGFHKNRETETLAFSTCSGVLAGGTGTSYFRSPYSIPSSKKC